ncbi:MAG TPA: methionine biosynthesis protein MetW [Nevskiales bacterium]|nr:methionine biosynthesis protein MetW [Nevskiales bacterium]
MRPDYAIICEWIRPGAHVLDLGCGDGTLLHYLQATRGVTGYGIEIDPDEVVGCIRKGVNVIQADLDAGLAQFENDSFDYVVMSEALQVVQRPDLLMDEILRVGHECIVTFPNFGHWRSRLAIGLHGRMPVSPALPAQWYDTPNIHLCTVRDFEDLCRKKGITVIRRSVVDHVHRSTLGMRLFPNLLGEIALYQLRRNGKSETRKRQTGSQDAQA